MLLGCVASRGAQSDGTRLMAGYVGLSTLPRRRSGGSYRRMWRRSKPEARVDWTSRLAFLKAVVGEAFSLAYLVVSSATVILVEIWGMVKVWGLIRRAHRTKRL